MNASLRRRGASALAVLASTAVLAAGCGSDGPTEAELAAQAAAAEAEAVQPIPDEASAVVEQFVATALAWNPADEQPERAAFDRAKVWMTPEAGEAGQLRGRVPSAPFDRIREEGGNITADADVTGLEWTDGENITATFDATQFVTNGVDVPYRLASLTGEALLVPEERTEQWRIMSLRIAEN
ncbi:hypothetical protein [Lolliginicoccus levis]|uniref:hypothetical protein n=1 Tax=Lolliginicoccus levis TaxID=2919542 RepID=UPI00241C0592|nr:hypothetical protein [Lolliginicoccus levis]